MADLPLYLDSNLDKPTKATYKLSQYADDIAIWLPANVRSPNNHVKEIVPKTAKSFQKFIDLVQKYLTDTGFELAPDKTQLIFFSTSKVTAKTKFSIQDHETRFLLEPCKQIKFLGVIFTATLNWAPHINHLAAKANRATNLIKALKYETWGRGTKLLLHLHQALVRLNLGYGAEGFLSAPKHTLKILEVAEMRSLKLIFDTPLYSKNQAIYVLANLMPLQIYRTQSCAKYLTRIFLTHNTAQESYNKELQTGLSASCKASTLVSITKNICTQANVVPHQTLTTPLSPVPPWTLLTASIKTKIPTIDKKAIQTYKKLLP